MFLYLKLPLCFAVIHPSPTSYLFGTAHHNSLSSNGLFLGKSPISAKNLCQGTYRTSVSVHTYKGCHPLHVGF